MWQRNDKGLSFLHHLNNMAYVSLKDNITVNDQKSKEILGFFSD